MRVQLKAYFNYLLNLSSVKHIILLVYAYEFMLYMLVSTYGTYELK